MAIEATLHIMTPGLLLLSKKLTETILCVSQVAVAYHCLAKTQHACCGARLLSQRDVAKGEHLDFPCMLRSKLPSMDAASTTL